MGLLKTYNPILMGICCSFCERYTNVRYPVITAIDFDSTYRSGTTNQLQVNILQLIPERRSRRRRKYLNVNKTWLSGGINRVAPNWPLILIHDFVGHI